MVARFDRYLLSQYMVLFGFFSLVLISVYWVNKAIGLFDWLISDGQSALVFLEFSALTLPNVIYVVLPLSAFVAGIYVTNRIASESELVVAQTSGMSSWRIVRPALYFGVVVALMVAILSHVLVPVSRAQMSARSAEISSDITARFLKAGEFLHPGTNMTVYIREISELGELRDVFLQDRRKPESSVTYVARRALLVLADAGPRLVMFEGQAQTLSKPDNRLSTVSFNDFAYDLSTLLNGGKARRKDLRELSTAALLHPTTADLERTKSTVAQFLFEGHDRFARPLFSMLVPVIGVACLLIGGFSRFGLWRQILTAVVLIILVQMSANIGEDLARRDAESWWLAYIPVIFAAMICCALLWRANRRAFFMRRVGVRA